MQPRKRRFFSLDRSSWFALTGTARDDDPSSREWETHEYWGHVVLLIGFAIALIVGVVWNSAVAAFVIFWLGAIPALIVRARIKR